MKTEMIVKGIRDYNGPLYERAKTGRMIPCDGEAHRNPFIDHCGYCAPRWGEVEELQPVDLVDAKKRGLMVRVADIEIDDVVRLKVIEGLLERGELKMATIRKRLEHGSTSSFCVYAWTTMSTSIERDEAVARLRVALRASTGMRWRVSAGRGSVHGFIYVGSSFGNPHGTLTADECSKIARAFGFEKPAHHDGIIIDPEHRAEYVSRAEQAALEAGREAGR